LTCWEMNMNGARTIIKLLGSGRKEVKMIV
jgi:hypothetical protein